MKEKVHSVARKVKIADVSPAGVVLHFDSGISVHYSSEFLWQNREVRGNEILPEPPPDEYAQGCANTPRTAATAEDTRMPDPELLIIKQRQSSAEGSCSACNALFSVSQNLLAIEELRNLFRDHVRRKHSLGDASQPPAPKL